MSKKICSISIKYNLDCDGLIGGTHEYTPYLTWYGSFGKHRVVTIDNLHPLDNSLTLNNRRRRRRHPLAAVKVNEEEEDKKSKEIIMDRTFPSYTERKSIEIELNDYDEMKGDDALMFKLFSHTRDSGVESIDKSESQFVERQTPGGLCHLELYDIFAYYLENCDAKQTGHYNQPRQTFSISDRFVDQKMLEEKARDFLQKEGETTEAMIQEAIKQAKPLTDRASIVFEITVRDFNYALYKKSIFNVNALRDKSLHSKLKLNDRSRMLATASLASDRHPSSCLPLRNTPEFESLLFNSKKSWQVMMRGMSGLLDMYCKHFISSRETGPSLLKASEPVIENLQLPLYNSENGIMPVYAYWGNHDPYFREYANEATRMEELMRYGFNADTETHFLMALRSSLRRHNLSEARFIETIERHFAEENKSEKLDAYFLLAEEVIADVGTFMANSGYYTADYRFVPLNEKLEDPHTGHHHKDLGETRRCRRCYGALKMKIVGLDSWDNVILNGTSMCDDCEGQDNTATSVIRAFSIGRADKNFTWGSPTLRAMQKLLSYSCLFDVGALVTSAYVDTNNEKIDARQEELPLIGSELDKNAQNDGHCFALMQSLTRAIQMLENGGATSDVIKKMRIANTISSEFEKRDAMRKILVLEPTGSIEPRILSLEESYGKSACDDESERLFTKKKAEMCFARNMRLRLKESEKESGVADLFVGEGMPHYIEMQVPERRVSDFYNCIVHGSSVDLYRRFDVTLSQVAFAKRVNNEQCYGVRIGELIRDNPSETQLSLICPYRDYKQRWLDEIVPLVESIENQMPLMKFGRYDPDEYKNAIYSRYATLTNIETKEEDMVAREAFEKLLVESESLDSGKTIVRLYSRVWKLQKNKEATERFASFLANLPGMIKYACYVERHMPVCDPIVDILCIVDVKMCLSLIPTKK